MKNKNFHHYLRFTDKSPSIVERVIRTLRNFLKKPVLEKRKASWTNELPSVIKQYNITIHNSMKKTPIQASRKANEKPVYSTLEDRRLKQKPKYELGQLVRTADIKRVFSKGDSTNYSYKSFSITEVLHDTIPSYKSNYKPER